MKVYFYLNWIAFLLGNIAAWFLMTKVFGWETRDSRALAAAVFLILAVLTVVAFKASAYRDVWYQRFIYILSFIWLGTLLNFALALIAVSVVYYGAVALGWDGNLLIFRLSVLISTIALSVGGLINAAATKVRRETVAIRNLPEDWVNKKIIHLADVHLGPVWRKWSFSKVIKKIQSLEADALFITGDLFDGAQADFPWAGELLSSLRAPLGTYYSLGNHDLELGVEKVRQLFQGHPVQILEDRLLVQGGLQIVGLNFRHKKEQEVPGEQLAKTGYTPNLPSILLYHEPKDPIAFKIAGIDLQLSGHTHAGQMFPFNFLAGRIYGWRHHGLYQEGYYSLSVTSGLGTWGPPMRLGSRSELVLITLKSA